jgi:GTP-binding protein HflX
VRDVLGEIGAGDITEVLALNKADLVSGPSRARAARRYPDAVLVSGLTGEGLEQLLVAVAEAMPKPPVEVSLLVPFGREDLTAMLYREAEVLSVEDTEDGTAVHARVEERQLAAVRDFVTRPVRRRVVAGGDGSRRR